MLCFSSFLVSCGKDNPSKPREPGWTSLGFEGHWALELELYWPYLYACAADEGLFRKNLYRATTQWEYVGLADSTLGHWANRGVQDVLLLDNGDILAGVITGREGGNGILRSSDGGVTWARSDSGIPDPSDPYASSVHTLAQSPCDTDVLFAGTAGAIYKSEDGGVSWSFRAGAPRTGLGVNAIEVHPLDCNLVWAGGETSRFQEILWRSTDGGDTWDDINLSQVVPHDNAVFRVAVDCRDPGVAYLAMLRGVIKTTDGGSSWISPLFTPPTRAAFGAMASDEKIPGHFLVACGWIILESWDGGDTVEILDECPNGLCVLDLEYRQRTKTLYVATAAGVYEYLLP